MQNACNQLMEQYRTLLKICKKKAYHEVRMDCLLILFPFREVVLDRGQYLFERCPLLIVEAFGHRANHAVVDAAGQ